MLTSKETRRSGGSASEISGGTRAVLDGSGVGSDDAGSRRCGWGLQDGGALLAEGIGRGSAASRAPRPALRLSLAEREEVSRGVARGEALTAIAGRLGRSVSTVSREVRRNRQSSGYRAVRADRMAQARTGRPRPGKLASNERLRAQVEEGLKGHWSPQQISYPVSWFGPGVG